MKIRLCVGLSAFVFFSIAWSLRAGVAETNSIDTFGQPADDLFAILLRMVGAFAVVVGVFLLGVWLFKRTRLFSLYQTGPAQLKILETRPLGYRNSLFVVGYGDQRFLLAASSTGVNLVSRLRDAPEGGSNKREQESFSERLDAIQGGQT